MIIMRCFFMDFTGFGKGSAIPPKKVENHGAGKSWGLGFGGDSAACSQACSFPSAPNRTEAFRFRQTGRAVPGLRLNAGGRPCLFATSGGIAAVRRRTLPVNSEQAAPSPGIKQLFRSNPPYGIFFIEDETAFRAGEARNAMCVNMS